MATYDTYKKKGYTDFAIKNKFGLSPSANQQPVAPTPSYQKKLDKRDDDRWDRVQESQGKTNKQIAYDRAINQRAVDQQARINQPAAPRTDSLPGNVPTPQQPMVPVPTTGVNTGITTGVNTGITTDQGLQQPTYLPPQTGSQFAPTQTPQMELKPSDAMGMNADQMQPYLENEHQRKGEVSQGAIDHQFTESEKILQDRQTQMEQEIEKLKSEPVPEEYQEQFDNTKAEIEDQARQARDRQTAQAESAGEQVAQQFSFSGFGRSSAHMNAQTDIKTQLGDAIKSIDMQAQGQVGELKINMLEKQNERITKLQDRLDSTQDARDQLALGKATAEATLMVDLFNTDPNNPQQVLATAEKMAGIKADMATALKEEKAAMREESTAIFENAIKYGYTPDMTDPNVVANLANTLGVSPDQVAGVITGAIEQGAIEKMIDKVQYFTDNAGQVMSVAIDPLSGEFVQTPLGNIAQNRDIFSMQSDGMGGMYIMDKTSGKIVGQQDAFGNFSGTGMPSGNGLGSFNGGGSAGSSQAILESKIYQTFDTPVNYMKDRHKHEALDFALPGGKGSPLESPASGKVTLLKDKHPGKNSGYGNQVIVTDAQGREHKFSHLGGFSVENGAYIEAGTAIGTQGNTGYAQPPGFSHVHYEVTKDGKRMDPEAVLEAISIGPSTHSTLTKETAMAEGVRRGITDTKELANFVKASLASGAIPEDRALQEKLWSELFTENRDVNDEMTVLQNGFATLESFDVNHENAYADYSLTFSFAKVLDPRSVVRGSEFDAIKGAGSALESLGANYRQVVEGKGMYTVEQRKKIIAEMQRLYDQKYSQYDVQIQSIQERGSRAGIPDTSMFTYIPEKIQYSAPPSAMDSFLGGVQDAFSGNTGGTTGYYITD